MAAPPPQAPPILTITLVGTFTVPKLQPGASHDVLVVDRAAACTTSRQSSTGRTPSPSRTRRTTRRAASTPARETAPRHSSRPRPGRVLPGHAPAGSAHAWCLGLGLETAPTAVSKQVFEGMPTTSTGSSRPPAGGPRGAHVERLDVWDEQVEGVSRLRDRRLTLRTRSTRGSVMRMRSARTPVNSESTRLEHALRGYLVRRLTTLDRKEHRCETPHYSDQHGVGCPERSFPVERCGTPHGRGAA